VAPLVAADADVDLPLLVDVVEIECDGERAVGLDGRGPIDVEPGVVALSVATSSVPSNETGASVAVVVGSVKPPSGATTRPVIPRVVPGARTLTFTSRSAVIALRSNVAVNDPSSATVASTALKNRVAVSSVDCTRIDSSVPASSSVVPETVAFPSASSSIGVPPSNTIVLSSGAGVGVADGSSASAGVDALGTIPPAPRAPAVTVPIARSATAATRSVRRISRSPPFGWLSVDWRYHVDGWRASVPSTLPTVDR
jgi:hypothetical protein